MNLVDGFPTGMKEDVKDQFMLGDNLLVAPMFAGDKKRKVVLPRGKWYDFYSGRLAGDGGVIEIEPGLDRIPLYVRDGGIIPMIPRCCTRRGKASGFHWRSVVMAKLRPAMRCMTMTAKLLIMRKGISAGTS